MTNLEKYNNVFIEVFEVKEDELNGLEYQGIVAWDSIGHLGLIGEIEDVFDIEMETDDVIEFSSYQKGMEILAKYNVKL